MLVLAGAVRSGQTIYQFLIGRDRFHVSLGVRISHNICTITNYNHSAFSTELTYVNTPYIENETAAFSFSAEPHPWGYSRTIPNPLMLQKTSPSPKFNCWSLRGLLEFSWMLYPDVGVMAKSVEMCFNPDQIMHARMYGVYVCMLVCMDVCTAYMSLNQHLFHVTLSLLYPYALHCGNA